MIRLRIISIIMLAWLGTFVPIHAVTPPECYVAFQKDSVRRSQQGMLLWGNRILAFEHGGHCRVYDRKEGKLIAAGDFDVESSSKSNHCNQANLGVEQLPGAEMPVVYLSVAKPGSPIDMRCHVESISRNGRTWSSRLVQTLELDTTLWAVRGLYTIFGAPSWLVDRERKALWVFSGHVRTVPKAMPDGFISNKLVATRFRIPALSEGLKVTLGADDVLEQVALDMDAYATQSGCVHDGKLYSCFGFGNVYPVTTSKIRVYDLDRRSVAARVDLDSLILEECEALMIDGDRMLVNTNSPRIYSVGLPEIDGDHKWKGTYRVDPFTTPEERTAPEGYVPFYLSSYCRHGIRHIDSASVLPMVRRSLEWGDSMRMLTPLGKVVMARFTDLWPTVDQRTGDLTAGGSRQWSDYALKLVKEYPELFTTGAIVSSQSTNVMRTARSMEAFMVKGDVSSRFHTWLNPYADGCPTKLPIDEEMRSRSGRWYPIWREYVRSHIDMDEWLGAIFTSPDSVRSTFDEIELCNAFFTLVCAAPALDRPESFSELFTTQQAEAMWAADNLRQYMQKGRHSVNLARGWQQAGKMLDNIITCADEDIASGRTTVRMRFGHDGCMMAMLAFLEAGTWGVATDDPAEIKEAWQTWRIPMASKVNFVLYRRTAEDPVLVKVLLNGEALSLPLPEAGSSRCYRWDDFRASSLSRIMEAASGLASTASTPLNK